MGWSQRKFTDSDDHMHVNIDIWDLDDTDALLMVKMKYVQTAFDSIIENIG